jgi:hypothetical protein
MLGLLVVLILLALVVCAAVTMPAVVTAGIVVAVAPCPSVCADCPVAARSAGDTARSGRSEDKKCAGGGIAPVATLVASGL